MSRAALRTLGFAAAVALVAAACSDDRATITDPVGRVYNARFARVALNMPRGTATLTGATGAMASRALTVRLQGLEELASGSYHVWIGTQASASAEPTNVRPASGTLRIIQTDTIIDAQGDPVGIPDTTIRTNAHSFTEGGGNITIVLRVDSASLADNGATVTDPAAYNLVFVTIEPTATTTPSTNVPAPLWARLFGLTGATRTANFRFGNYHPDPAQEYVFTASGRGMIGVYDNILVVDDSALALPPKGYFYATALVRESPGAAGAIDTTFFDLGPQKAPYPRRDVSLREADMDQTIDPTIVNFPPSILAASERVRIDTISGAMLTADQPFRGFRDVRVTLEAKAGIAAPSPTVILLANFPDIVSKPQED